ncbi:MAG: ABC transporter permease [Promethearchaeota archaeon]|jgi:putative ABC transport system permease protein
MAFSVAVIIFAVAMGEAFYHQLVNVGIKTTTGHVQVFPLGWDFDIIRPMSGDIPKLSNSSKIEKIISKAPFYKAHGREILYQILLYDHTDDYYYAVISGVEPEKVTKTHPGLKLLKGKQISLGVADGVLISKDMENYFNPTLDNMMYIITRGPGGMMEGVKTRFKGVVKSMPLFTDHVAFISLSKVQELLSWGDDECSTIKVILQDKNKAEQSAAWLKKKFTSMGLKLNVMTWKELGGFYYHIALLGRVLVFFLLLILAAITGISVSNTMLMSVKERTREIGTMMAMGLRKRRVTGLFLLESFSLSLISTIGGVVLGSGVNLWFQRHGIVEGLALVLEGRLYPILGFYPVLFSFLWILAIGTAGGFYPAYKAANLDPIEALRYV